MPDHYHHQVPAASIPPAASQRAYCHTGPQCTSRPQPPQRWCYQRMPLPINSGTSIPVISHGCSNSSSRICVLRHTTAMQPHVLCDVYALHACVLHMICHHLHCLVARQHLHNSHTPAAALLDLLCILGLGRYHSAPGVTSMAPESLPGDTIYPQPQVLHAKRCCCAATPKITPSQHHTASKQLHVGAILQVQIPGPKGHVGGDHSHRQAGSSRAAAPAALGHNTVFWNLRYGSPTSTGRMRASDMNAGEGQAGSSLSHATSSLTALPCW